jgi:hypothetical protein
MAGEDVTRPACASFDGLGDITLAKAVTVAHVHGNLELID